MSAVIAVPELIAQTATDLTAIATALDAAHLTAAAPTQTVLPAAADEVSAGIAHLFSGYGQQYQVAAEQAAQYQQRFAEHLMSAASGYAGAEATNVSLLQPLAAAASAAALPSLDQLLSSLMPLVWETLAVLYYALFSMLIAVYAALLIYLPLAVLGSLIPV
ncbi:hypothetical protein A5634_20035 [Mycobacterium asiaticum]|uniref:PE domain-containing protein n=1 Tax=Mycobacterium asiaticum TaxID=1790 RepID=A0A1A3P5M7_MYCAS|nr:PE family protein [Mycobacterium asiaticum]OBK28599.1 hypothetical protein A5634_20035 [Mycobacterium asiaticum]